MAIRLLPAAIVNRIAAGEVIERPAAAAKELAENALDAGASRVAVALAGGGIDRIEVADNGCGMDAADLAMAVQRHATSKLADDDLVRIRSLGFRGEALPSIGAAARLAIISRPQGAPHAHAIRVEGSEVSEVTPSAGPPGTRVVVRDLFFATPARRKFLRHPATEAEHAEMVLRRLALAAPGVAFRVQNEERTVFDLPGQDRAGRVSAVFGAEATAALIPIAAERGALRLAGFVTAPSLTRASAAAQAFTVNGRPVADPVLRTAVRIAYRDVIAASRHPMAALWIDLPPDEVDVNVHPAKAELRFRDAGAVRALVIGALRRALAGAVGAVPAHRPALTLTPSRPRDGGMRAVPLPGLAHPELALAAAPATRPFPVPELRADHPLGAPLGQVAETYIVAVAADDALVLVDQHAAHERLTHEALHQQLLGGDVHAQPLLVPAVVELPTADAARLAARADELGRLGLHLELFGPGAVLIRALPAALGAPDPAPLIRDLADELREFEETTALTARLDVVIARLACHGSIRAGRRLSREEMDALLRRMEETPRAATCSHGRPTVLRFTREELAAMFRRG
jgi:DNA mismatch repair protein MutL